MLKTYEINLDIENELYTPSNLLFSVSRNDFESIELDFKINQDGAPMNLTGTTIELAIKKPSGLVVYQDCEITDAVDGEAAARLSIQAYVEYGVHTAEVYIRNTGQMGVTCPFYFMSREAIMETEAIESINDWSALQQAFFAYDKKPILVEGIPTEIPEYVGQMAFDFVGKRAFIANDLTAISWQLLAAGEGGGGIVSWADILGKPTEFTPENHMHNIAAITDLQTTLDGKADDSDLTPFITETEADAKYSLKGEGGGGITEAVWGEVTGTLSNQTDLQNALNAKADDSDLTGKADVNHTHAFADITGKPATYPAENHVHTIGDVTNLSTILDGKADDADLTAKANAADVYTKAQVYNKTEIDQLTMGEGGGSPVIVEDNLASSSTSNALSANQGRILDEGKADVVHTHAFADITGKPATYPAATHTHLWADITDKPTTFTPSAHNHAIAEVTGLQTALDGKADDSDLAGKADINHTHAFADITGKPATYPPEAHTHLWTQITDKPTTFTPSAHNHGIAEVTGLQTALDGKADDAEIASLQANIDNKQDEPIQTAAAPVSTPTHIGQMAIDTTNKRTYIAEGATAGDWRRMAGTNYVDAGDNAIMALLGGLSLWKGTQAAYDAIGTKDPNKLYFIVG